MNTNINMTDKEYSDFVDSKAKKSPVIKNIILAFISGGIICMLGQFITDIAMSYGYDKTYAGMICSIVLIFIGAFLTAIKVYAKIGKYCGAGSAVPITGFSNSIVSPAIEFKTEGYVLGLGANMFKVAGPVLVYGVASSMILGFIYWILKFLV